MNKYTMNKKYFSVLAILLVIVLILSSNFLVARFDRIARNNNIPFLCNFARIIKDDCYHDVAVLYGDYSNCDKISSYTTKNDCFTYAASRTGDISYCNKIDLQTKSEEYEFNNCIVFIAAHKKNIDVCNNIIEQSSNFKVETNRVDNQLECEYFANISINR